MNALGVIQQLVSEFENPNQPNDGAPSGQPGGEPGVLANLIAGFEHGQGNAIDVITNFVEQLEGGNKLELDNLLAAHGNQLQQLQELVQGLTDGHNSLTNAGQLQQLVQDLASGHNPLVNSGEETIHIGQVDPHHGFIHA